MVGAKQDIGRFTFLASITVTHENSFAPLDCFSTVADATCMFTKIRDGRVKLGSNHGSPAFMGTEDMTIAALAHLLDFGRIARKPLATKGAGKDGFLYS